MRITLGDLLCAFGVITRAQLREALAVQAGEPHRKLGEILVGLKFASWAQVSKFLDKQGRIAQGAIDPDDAATVADYATHSIIERAGGRIGDITGIYKVSDFAPKK